MLFGLAKKSKRQQNEHMTASQDSDHKFATGMPIQLFYSQIQDACGVSLYFELIDTDQDHLDRRKNKLNSKPYSFE